MTVIALRNIKRMFNRPDRSPVAPAHDSVRPVKLAGSSIADALTPASLIALLRNADQGSLTDQIDLFQAMEDRDPKLDGFMRQRKLGLLAHGWELVEGRPTGQTGQTGQTGPTGQTSRTRDFCQEILAAIPQLEDRLFDLLDALGKGFAALEIEWGTSESQWRPTNLLYRPQSWFVLSQAGDEIHLKTEQEQLYGEELNHLNWVLHRHRARSGFDPRTGLYRSCARPFVVRNYGFKDWLAFAEIFGMPLRVGKYRQGATDDEKSEMWTALQALGIDCAALIPEGAEIEFPSAAGSAASDAIFRGLIDAAEDDYVIAILGQRLTTGGQKGGSYALGKIHEGVRLDLVMSDAARLAETLTMQLLRPIVRLNFGDDAPVPEWRFKVEAPEDMKQLAEVVKTLAEAGQPVPVRWVADRFGIPLPHDGEDVLRRT